MLLIKAEVRPSNILGKGLFALENVKKGAIVCLFSLNGKVITEQEFVQAVDQGIYPVMRTGTRLMGKYFVYCPGDEEKPWSYVNHSFKPSMLCHCGICVAKRDIAAGEELTVDYRDLLDTTDVGLYGDATTGEEIRGRDAKQTLLRTARELLELVEGIEGWQG